MNDSVVFDAYYNWADDKQDVSFEKMQELIYGYANSKPDEIPPTIDEILKSSNINTILDYGGGLGRNLPTLLSYSKHVDYADLSNYKVKFGEYIDKLEYKEKTYIDGLVLDKLPKDYDLVYASVVLQHIVDDTVYERIVKTLAERTRFLLILQNLNVAEKYSIIRNSFELVHSQIDETGFNNCPHKFLLYKTIS